MCINIYISSVYYTHTIVKNNANNNVYINV